MVQTPRPRWSLLLFGGSLIVLAAALELRPEWTAKGLGWLDASARSALIDLAVLLLSAASLLMLGAAFLLPEPPRSGRWAQQLSLYRSRSALRVENPNPAALQRLFARMDDDAMRVASILPSHSIAGRAAAAAEIGRRNAPVAPPLTPMVPGFFGREQLHRASEIVFGAAARTRTIAGGLSVLGFAIAVGLLVWNYFAAQHLEAKALNVGIPTSVFDSFDGNPSVTIVPPELAAFPEAGAIVLRTNLALIACGIWLFSWTFLKLAQWFRAYPVRVVLLRKFNERRLGALYKRLLREELQMLGHVVALADKHVRRTMGSWFSHQFYVAASSFGGAIWVAITLPITLVLRLFDRTRWGPAVVTSARDFRLLARRLHDRMELNIETSTTARAYLIRTSDAWWKLVADVLLRSADVIVLDLSNVTQGTAWEIEMIGRLNLWNRVACIAHGESEAVATGLEDTLSANGASPVPVVFSYDDAGRMIDRQGFRAHLISALRASVEAKCAEGVAAHDQRSPSQAA